MDARVTGSPRRASARRGPRPAHDGLVLNCSAPARMPKLSDALVGPWRAVTVLGVTQILAWGTMFYTPVLMLPLLAADRGWTSSFAMAGFSAGLLVAGFGARFVGVLIGRHGWPRVRPAGSPPGARAPLGPAP